MELNKELSHITKRLYHYLEKLQKYRLVRGDYMPDKMMIKLEREISSLESKIEYFTKLRAEKLKEIMKRYKDDDV